MDDLNDIIPAESGSGLCAICDNAVEEWEEAAIAIAHGNKYLCHSMCLHDGDAEDD